MAARPPGRDTTFSRTHWGSVFELETQTELSARLGFIHDRDAIDLADKIRGIGRGLSALMRYVEEEARTQPKRT